MESISTSRENIQKLKVPERYAGVRADVAISEIFNDFSRAQVTRFIKSNKILVEGKAIKPSKLFEGGETITFSLPEKSGTDSPRPENIPLNIIFEDDYIIVVDKPEGLVVHPGSGVLEGTLVNGLLYHYPELANVGETGRPGIVHRLDKETSGVMVIARNDKSREFLISQFKQRNVKKEYLAIICGVPVKDSGVFASGIGRHAVNRTKMSSRTNSAKEARTSWSVVRRFNNHALVKAVPMTGRTHQIRVHFSEAGFPLLRDRIYGYKKSHMSLKGCDLKRHALHAKTLRFNHPGTGKEMKFSADLPRDLTAALEILGAEQD